MDRIDGIEGSLMTLFQGVQAFAILVVPGQDV